VPIVTSIRPARSDDRAFAVAAAQRLATGRPAWRTAEEVVAGETRTLEAFFSATPPSGSAMLIAESEGGERLGFVYLERLRDYFTLEEHGHVGMLVVAPEAEGRGVGSTLMRAAERWARERGDRRLTLAVFEENREARARYHHLGYATETLRYVKML
jgi:GNAT superfamily N-acetyltransferase